MLDKIILFFIISSIICDVTSYSNYMNKVCYDVSYKKKTNCEDESDLMYYPLGKGPDCCKGRKTTSNSAHCCYHSDEISYENCMEISDYDYYHIDELCEAFEEMYEAAGIRVKVSIDCKSNYINILLIYIYIILIIL